MGNYKIIDLSVTLINSSPDSPNRSVITYRTHEETARELGKARGLPEDFFSDGRYCALEETILSTHAGTHLDAPFHWGPFCENIPAKTIDMIPLEWLFGDGVVLDFTHKRAGELILAKEIQNVLDKIKYNLKPMDIVLIRTDASKFYGQPGYENRHPGMSRESTMWLIDHGIKVMGIDAWGWDRPFNVMIQEMKNTGNKKIYWEAHFCGREKEYCHLENMANLDRLPVPFGFKVAVFPISIANASAGWVRAVAILGI